MNTKGIESQVDKEAHEELPQSDKEMRKGSLNGGTAQTTKETTLAKHLEHNDHSNHNSNVREMESMVNKVSVSERARKAKEGEGQNDQNKGSNTVDTTEIVLHSNSSDVGNKE